MGKKELTFKEFSDKLKGMNQRCASCKYLEDNRICRKHNIERTNQDPKCEDWRYFA